MIDGIVEYCEVVKVPGIKRQRQWPDIVFATLTVLRKS